MTLYNRVSRVEIETSSGERVTLRGLRFVFKAQKIEGDEPNKLDLDIFNLSEDTRNKLRDTNKNVSLWAGYSQENGEELVFTGDITEIKQEIQKPNVITRIFAQDGKVSVDKARVSISLGEKSSARGVLQRILGAFDIGNNINQITINDKNYENGFSFAGSAKKALSDVCDFLELSWSVQNNSIILTPFDGDDNTGTIFLSPSTGLIGSPERVNGEARKAKNKSKKTTPGWVLTSLLLPSVNPLNRISVQSQQIQDRTTFSVTTVTHTGDTFGQAWESVIEVKE